MTFECKRTTVHLSHDERKWSLFAFAIAVWQTFVSLIVLTHHKYVVIHNFQTKKVSFRQHDIDTRNVFKIRNNHKLLFQQCMNCDRRAYPEMCTCHVYNGNVCLEIFKTKSIFIIWISIKSTWILSKYNHHALSAFCCLLRTDIINTVNAFSHYWYLMSLFV